MALPYPRRIVSQYRPEVVVIHAAEPEQDATEESASAWTLRFLPAHDHIVCAGAVLARPPRDNELLVYYQELGSFSRVLLGHAHLRGQTLKTADAGQVPKDCASDPLGDCDVTSASSPRPRTRWPRPWRRSPRRTHAR
jgi:hypothetical protein